jgi:hypothetical protein
MCRHGDLDLPSNSKNAMKTPAFVVHLGVLSLLLLGARLLQADDAPATYLLQSGRQPGQLDRVVIVLEIAGDRLDPGGQQVHRLALSGSGNLAYEEKTLEAAATCEGHSRSARYYDDARAVIKVGDRVERHSLRPARRLIAVDVDCGKSTLYSPRGMFTSDELDLIDISANSLLLEYLLPAKPVAVGQKWRLTDKLLAMILQLDEIHRSQVECLLKEVTPAVARIELAGSLSGSVHGVPCELEIKAKCRFDRQSNRIDWVAMLIDDKREPSGVEHGLDAVAKLTIKISPKGEALWLAPRALAEVPAAPSAELCRLLCQPAEAAWQLPHDRCWFLVPEAERRDAVALRMMADGANVAQCNVSSLPKVAVERLPTLEQFQGEVRHALGESFGQFVEAAQFASEADYRIYRVVAKGEVSEMPIQWHYYLVADKHGRQVALAFTIREQNLEAFDKAGERLVRGLRFLDPQAASPP